MAPMYQKHLCTLGAWAKHGIRNILNGLVTELENYGLRGTGVNMILLQKVVLSGVSLGTSNVDRLTLL